MNQDQALSIIKRERDYQIQRWGTLDNRNNVGDFIIYMKNYLTKAEISNNPDEKQESLYNIMKVAAIGVACMERHGITENFTKG